MKKTVLIAILVAIAANLVNAILYTYEYNLFLTGSDDSFFYLYSNLSVVLWSALASIVFFSVMKDFGLKNPSGRIWLIMGIGMLFWCLGELIWMIFVILEIEPFPSLADYFYTISYPIIFIGILYQLSLAKIPLKNAEKGTILVISTAIFLFTLYYVILPIYDSYLIEETSFLEMFLLFLYPLGDLILTPPALLLFFKFKGGEFGRSWFIIAISMIVMIAGDLVFAYVDYQGFEWGMFIYDHFYNISYILFWIGALHLHSSMTPDIPIPVASAISESAKPMESPEISSMPK